MFQVIGGVTVGIGVWIIYDKDYMSPLFGTELMTVSAYLIVAGGISLVLFSFVGCMAAFYQNKSLLLMVRLKTNYCYFRAVVTGQIAVSRYGKHTTVLQFYCITSTISTVSLFLCVLLATLNISRLYIITDFIYIVNSVITIQ